MTLEAQMLFAAVRPVVEIVGWLLLGGLTFLWFRAFLWSPRQWKDFRNYGVAALLPSIGGDTPMARLLERVLPAAFWNWRERFHIRKALFHIYETLEKKGISNWESRLKYTRQLHRELSRGVRETREKAEAVGLTYVGLSDEERRDEFALVLKLWNIAVREGLRQEQVLPVKIEGDDDEYVSRRGICFECQDEANLYIFREPDSGLHRVYCDECGGEKHGWKKCTAGELRAG